MPSVPNSTISERIGVYYTGYVFSLAGIIFRETPNTDVGIDAQIELVDQDGHATGKMVGIQIKSGDSFVDLERGLFTLRAERKHFEYWSRYVLPVIGVVFSPSLTRAVWVNLTEQTRRILEDGGPYRITEAINDSNELTEQNIPRSLLPFVHRFYGMPVPAEELERVAEIQKDQGQPVDSESKEAAWKRLTNILLASSSTADVLADAGHRLSWYFPAVPQSQKDFFIERISYANDAELANVIQAIHYVLSIGQDHVGELICDLLAYLPDPVERLKHVGRQKIVPADELEALFQSIEYHSQEFEEEYREEILNLYGIVDTDLP